MCQVYINYHTVSLHAGTCICEFAFPFTHSHTDNFVFIYSTEDLDQLFIDVTQRVLSLCHDYVFGESDGTCLHLVVEVHVYHKNIVSCDSESKYNDSFMYTK